MGSLGSLPRRACLLVLLAAGLTVGPPPAPAAPILSIRAHTDVRVTAVRKVPGGLRVTGVLVDRATATGVAGQQVTVTIDGRTGSGVTAADGVFELLVRDVDGARPVDVDVRFDGGDRLDPAAVVERAVDPSKAPVDLAITATPSGGGALVTVDARVDGAAIAVPVEVRITAADGAAGRDLRFTTGVPQLVTRTAAGGPGPRRIAARFAGDAGRAPATAESPYTFTTATRIEVAVGSASVAFEGTVRVKGKVVDDDGAPVPRVAIAVTADDRRMGATTTGADGTYKLAIAAERLGTGKRSLQAAVESKDPWLTSSRSGPAFVTIGTPRSAPTGITIAAFVATALTTLGFVLARRRRDAALTVASAPPPPAADPVGGLEPARASLVSTLRRASDHGFAGLVRDAVRQRPVGTAEVRVTLGGSDLATLTDPDGRFALEQLSPGEWRARVSAPGHVTERFLLSIPHRGELRGVHVDLVPVREKVWNLYRRAAQPRLPDPELWGIWSPRQIVHHLRTGAPTPAFSELTALVEEAFFSARTPEEAILPGIEQKVQAALAERGAAIPAIDRAAGV